MPAQQQAEPEEKLKALFSKLDAALKSQTGSLKKKLKLIDSILALAPNDADALKCRVIVLVQYDEFQQALDAIAASGDVADELLFEKAYCYYRLGQLEQALAAVQGVLDARRLARLQLEAQLHYRLGDNKQAIKVYRELFQTHKVETLELRTNVIAAYVCGGHADKVPDIASAMQISPLDSSDIGFNMACALLQLGSFTEAEELLQLALRAGREALLEEDIPEEEAAEELAPLTAQLAYAHGELGCADEAAAAYQDLEAMEGVDQPTAAVVRNNVAVAACAAAAAGGALKKAAADALKRLEGLYQRTDGRLAAALEARLMDSQQEALLGNKVLLLLAAQKADAAGSAFQALASRFPAYTRLPLLQAALLAQAGKLGEAAAALEDSIDALGLPALLMRAQLALAGGDTAVALRLLTGLPDEAMRHQPAVVATVVSLQEQGGDQGGALQTLRSALQWWRNSMVEPPQGGQHPEHWLLQRLVEVCVASGDVAEARRLYGELAAAGAPPAVQADALAVLAAAHGLRHESGVEELASALPAIDTLDAAAVSKLENAAAAAAVRRPREEAAPAAGAPAAAAQSDDTAGADDAALAKKSRKRKKRKPRYSKDYDPANPGPPPDPERWLPKWQRSDVKKPRKSRRIKEAVKGSQGQGRVDESLDASKRAAPEATASQQAPPGKAAVKSAGGGRRKGRR